MQRPFHLKIGTGRASGGGGFSGGGGGVVSTGVDSESGDALLGDGGQVAFDAPAARRLRLAVLQHLIKVDDVEEAGDEQLAQPLRALVGRLQFAAGPFVVLPPAWRETNNQPTTGNVKARNVEKKRPLNKEPSVFEQQGRTRHEGDDCTISGRGGSVSGRGGRQGVAAALAAQAGHAQHGADGDGHVALDLTDAARPLLGVLNPALQVDDVGGASDEDLDRL